MVFLRSHSNECMSSELDIFSIPPTQTSIKNSCVSYYKPVFSLNDDTDTPLKFVVVGSGDYYLDKAHTMLYLEVKISLKHSEEEDVKVGPVNNFLHSLFNQNDVFYNNKLVTPSSNFHASLEALLNYENAAKSSHLTASFWYDDEDNRMEAPPNGAQGQQNLGLVKRQLDSLHGETFDLAGHLHDVFNQDKMILNGVEMRIRLVRNKDSFALIDASTDSKFKIQMKEATLAVRRAKISPGVLLSHANGLSKTTAKYPITCGK